MYKLGFVKSTRDKVDYSLLVPFNQEGNREEYTRKEPFAQ